MKIYFATTKEPIVNSAQRGVLALLWLCLLMPIQAVLASSVISIVDPPDAPLGKALSVLTESASPLTLEEVRGAIGSARFQALNNTVIGFGIGHRPVWLHLAVENTSNTPLRRELLIGQAWLDHVDVYILNAGLPIGHYLVGDAIAGMPGLAGPQGFRIEHVFPPGRSDLLIRVQTPDPMVFNLRLYTLGQAEHATRWMFYGYGLLYGFLLSLAAYNVLLFFGLGRRAHLSYALYLFSFIGLNICYTGHGAYWLWPSWPGFQNYVILCLMVLMPYCGLRFARDFLELDQNAPRLSRKIRIGYRVALGTITLATILERQDVAAWLAFVTMALFIVAMVSLGIYAVRKRWGGAKYFLIAALASMLGTTLTEFSVWGQIPFNIVTFHGMELGMMLDATILALALAYFVRVQMDKRERAEQAARMDPLTKLYNRRGFQSLTEAPFLVAARHQRPLSVLLLDIDHFKKINDRYGHATGDEALVKIARVLSQSARGGDVAARWGGEEFALLLPETKLDEACLLAERLRAMIAEIVISDAHRKLRLTASFGVASIEPQKRLEDLLAAADKALYAAKSAGRNRVAKASGVEFQVVPQTGNNA